MLMIKVASYSCVYIYSYSVIARFDGYLTNHLLRATTAMRLFGAKIDEQLIMQRTGHTSGAVRTYKRVGEKLRTETSDILSGSTCVKDTSVVKIEKIEINYK